jgi:hypothetical protein
MARKIISKMELLEKLNTELSKYPEYYECRYEDVEQFDAPDETGCNWGHPLLVCKGTHPDMIKPEGFRLPLDLREEYNIS